MSHYFVYTLDTVVELLRHTETVWKDHGVRSVHLCGLFVTYFNRRSR